MNTPGGTTYSQSDDQLSFWDRTRLTWRLLRDERVPSWNKAAVPAIAAIYLFMPIDIIPDFILGLGQLDDLSVLGISIFAMTRLLPRLAPRDVVSDHIEEMRGHTRSNGRTEQTVIDPVFTVVDRSKRESKRA